MLTVELWVDGSRGLMRETEVVSAIHLESAETAVWEVVDEMLEEKRDG